VALIAIILLELCSDYHFFQELPQDKVLSAVKVFTTRDKSLAVNIFHFNGASHVAHMVDEYQANGAVVLARELQQQERVSDHALLRPGPELEMAALQQFFA